MLSLLATTVVLAEPGGDAPDDWADAVTVAAGAYNGTLDAVDKQDWYRFVIPSGAALRLTLTVPNGPATGLNTTDDAGGRREVIEVGPQPGSNATTLSWTGTYARSGEALRVGVQRWLGNVTYELVAEEVPLPDFAVTNLTVTPQPNGTMRTLAFDVTNAGIAAGAGNVQTSVYTITDRQTTRIDEVPVALASGETRHVEVAWDAFATGTVGRATVTARASVGQDANATNDAQTTAATGLFEQVGAGITLGTTSYGCWLPPRTPVVTLPVGACHNVSARPAEWTLGAGGGTLVGGLGAQVTLSRAGVDTIAGGYASAPYSYGYLSARRGPEGNGTVLACARVLIPTVCQAVPTP